MKPRLGPRPRLLVFASGTADSGGHGFRQLCRAMYEGELRAEIVGVVSNHLRGGVSRAADEFGIPFTPFPAPFDADGYRSIVAAHDAEWCALSGWLKLAIGLDPRTTTNIHPGPLPRFGGRGMHGLHVHAAALEAFRRGEIMRSEIAMHFVTEAYDQGPVFFRRHVPILADDIVETLAARVNAVGQEWQARMTDLVVHGVIRWDGEHPESLVSPGWCLNPVSPDGPPAN